MNYSQAYILISIIALAIIAIAVFLRRKKDIKPFIMMKQFIIGILVSLTGAFLMWNGSILGENTTGIATVIGIVGIGLIATSRKSKKTPNQ